MQHHEDAPTSATAPDAAPAIADDALHIMEAIVELTRHGGRPPTYREVLAHLGITSHRRLSEGLNELVHAGRLQRLSGSRNLIVAADTRHPMPD